MIKLYTIGFTNKSAERFFELLEHNQIVKIIDTRINNVSQLSGFAKAKDLEFFARRLSGINYEHKPDFAPTKELLDAYRNKRISWIDYSKEYIRLLEERNVGIYPSQIEQLHNSCLLCSEHSPEQCHRKLLAEFLKQKYPEIQIIHLK